jgi:hypothetical protein
VGVSTVDFTVVGTRAGSLVVKVSVYVPTVCLVSVGVVWVVSWGMRIPLYFVEGSGMLRLSWCDACLCVCVCTYVLTYVLMCVCTYGQLSACRLVVRVCLYVYAHTYIHKHM